MKPAGVRYLDAVREDKHPDLRPQDTVITMNHSIGYCLLQRTQRIGGKIKPAAPTFPALMRKAASRDPWDEDSRFHQAQPA